MTRAEQINEMLVALGLMDKPSVREMLNEVLLIAEVRGAREMSPIVMRITCPECGELHIDEGEYATTPHSTHVCQKCGLPWKPSLEPTVGVRFLPGTKNT